MALQSSNLRMVSLSSVGDAPPNTMQPPLKDGIHLRWAFDPPLGFPWYGYYLFRRPSREQPKRCLGRELTAADPSPVGATQLSTTLATVTSDRPLVLIDHFPPAGQVELDLRNRRWILATLPAGQLAPRVYVTLGFRGRGDRTCANLDRLEQGDQPNPLNVDEVELLALDPAGNPLPTGRISGPGPTGWDAGWTTHVTLPCPAYDVRVTLLSTAEPATVESYDGNGALVDAATMSAPGLETLGLTGAGITRLIVIAPQDETHVITVCWVCAGDEAEPADVTVRTLLSAATLDQTTVSGLPGEVRTVELGADTIEAVEVSGGADAAVIDICFEREFRGVGSGWQPLPGFPQPLSLPVDHADYPCPGHPATAAAAEATALNRVRYGNSGPWGGASFADLRNRLRDLVKDGPIGPSMYDRFEPVAGTPPPPPEVGGDIVHQQQRPLDLVLLGSLHPAIAEMVGLAWVDDTAVPAQPYDYLIIADHDGSLGGSAASALAWLAAPNFAVVDGYVILGRVLAPPPPLPAPTDLRAYALPGGTVELSGGGVLDATNNAGLVWERQLSGKVLAGGAPVLYHVWRADLGDEVNPPSPPPSAFKPLTEKLPIPVGLPLSGSVTPPPAPQWPPFPMLYIDRAVKEGWYAYHVSGVDVFGRHSPGSDPAQWWQWAPRPDPAPWYYQGPPADKMLDGGRIRLLDKLPPPPPSGVEAFALDPDDPTVQRDSAWQAWWASLSPAEQTGLIGGRVRWRWTPSQQRQAPDTREFRVYYQAAPINSLPGRADTVTPAGATQSVVTTDIPNVHPAGTFNGLSLRVGGKSFRIAGSQAGSPLTVTVDNIGPSDEVRPVARARCSLAIPPGHSLSTDYGAAVEWDARVLSVGYQQHVSVDGNGSRTYQVFLPVPGSADRSGLPLTTTVAEPIGYGLIGVTAADNKSHTPDVHGDAARYGNESRVGGPATVFRVRRVKPPAPVVPPDSEKVFASPADYQGRSYYTFRWMPSAQLRTHVFRALDHALYRADVARRPRSPLATNDPAFPSEFVPAKRTAVAAELNALNAFTTLSPAAMTAYTGLSNDGLRVLAALPGVEKAFVQVTADPLDPDEPDAGAPGGLRWRQVGPDMPVGSLPPGQRAYVDTLDGRTRSRWFYRSAYADEVGNAGPLGVSSPPVWLPPVVPPRRPLIARVTGGELRITIAWASNREPDLVAYHVYRADDPDAARDVRLMTQVGIVAVPAGDPASRPATVSWSDDPVPGLTTFVYRVVAADSEGNQSEPSRPVAGRAHDTALPVVPALTAQWSATSPPTAATLAWTSPDETLLELRTADSLAWAALGDWRAPGAHSESHQLNGELAWRFRLRARRTTGALRVGPTVPLDAL